MRRTLVRFWSLLRGSRLSARGIAWSVATGLMIGLLPVYGLHGLLVLAVCLPLRLDAAVAFASTMISNPLTLPFLIAAELRVGAAIVGEAAFDPMRLLDGEGWSEAAVQLLVGTSVLATLVGAMGALVAWLVVRRLRAADGEG